MENRTLICEACKRYWIGPKTKCVCGSTALVKTHPLNRKFAENYNKVK